MADCGKTIDDASIGEITTTPADTDEVLMAQGSDVVTAAWSFFKTLFLQPGNNLDDLDDAATARGNLGLGSAATSPSSAFQAASSVLTTLAALANAKGNIIVNSGSGWQVLTVGTDDQVLKADSAESLGLKWDDESDGGGGASITLDTRANILATASPSSGDMFFSTDTYEFFVYDGANFQVAPLEHQSTSTSPDIGLQPPTVVNDRAGYSDEYITDKLITHSKFGANDNTEDGGKRFVDGVEQTYANGTWNDVVTGFRFREDSGDGDTGNVYELEHRPVGLTRWYEVMSGNSDALGINGLPITQQYSTDIGAYPTHLQIVGRSFD